MTHELTKEEHAEMTAATEEGIERGYDAAKAEWKARVRVIVIEYAKRNQTFTVNEIRDQIAHVPTGTHDGRALGGVVKALEAEHIIEGTGQTVASIRGHKSRIQIWRSKIYQPAAEQATLPL